jgi:hypothetical protein
MNAPAFDTGRGGFALPGLRNEFEEEAGMSTRMLSVMVIGLAALLGAGSSTPSAAPGAPRVREIPDVALGDVAVAVYDSVRPVIYYNPTLMTRFGPELAAFFMAHEHAHITLKHTRSGALLTDPSTRDHLLQQKELEADCLAARSLGTEGRDASLAAVRFFSQLGDRSFDTEHPTGTTRAERILSCMNW